MKKLTIVLFISIALTSCATLFGKKHTEVTIMSNIPAGTKVNIDIDNKEYTNVTLPMKAMVKKNGKSVIKADAFGYVSIEPQMATKTKNSLGNQLGDSYAYKASGLNSAYTTPQNTLGLGGLTGVFSLVDQVTGANKKLKFKTVYIYFKSAGEK